MKYAPMLRNVLLTIDMKEVDEQEREEAKVWLSKRFVRLGCEPEVLIVRKVAAEKNKDSGELGPLVVLSESRYELY